MNFPADSVLVLRGRYATLGAEYRACDKTIQLSLQAIDNARRKLYGAIEFRTRADFSGALERLAEIQNAAEEVFNALVVMQKLAPQMEELKPEAWGKEHADV